MKTYRIDPAIDGIHLVDISNGGERVYITYNQLDNLISELNEVRLSVKK